MNIFTQGKTNWKHILIVLILVIFVGGGVLWYAVKPEIPFTEFPKIEELEKIKEITKPPTIAGLLNDPKLKEAEEVEVVGKYAYVIGGEGLIIIDISNLRNPTIVSSIDISGVGISILDEYAYIVGSSILTIVDISNPASPKIIIAFQDPKLPRGLQDIQVKGEYAYIINNNNWPELVMQELVIVDVSDLKNPEIVSSIVVSKERYGFHLKKIFLSENYCYIVSWSGGDDALTIIDISNPKNPKKLSSLSDGKLWQAMNIFVSGKYAYIITGNNILAIIDISDSTVPSIVNLIEDKKFGFGRKVYVLDKYAYVIGREALTIINISNPTAPEIITSISDLKFEGARDLYVSGRYGYIIAPDTQAFVVVDFKGEIIFEGKPISILSKDVLEFEEKFVKENEREIAFLQDGNIWVISKDLKKKYKISEEEYKAIIGKEENYWIEGGELFKKDEEGKIKILVSKEKMEEKILDMSFWEMESFSYLKGEVMSFSLSPDGKYIAYETLEGYTACCLAPPTLPITSIWIMRNDGSRKVEIEKPPMAGELVGEWGWIPNSQMIFVRLTYSDAGFPSPFYKFGANGKYLGRFEGFPLFSPDGTKMAETDVWGEEISIVTLEKGEIKERKVILKGKTPFVGAASQILQWSEDSSLLLVRGIDEVFLFNSRGQMIFEQEFPDAEKVQNVILSPDNKYLGGVYMLKKERIEIFFFINLLTDEKKEFKLPKFEDYSGTINIYPQFFSEENRLYYLIELKGEHPINQLWVVDINTWENYKIAENVSQVVKVP